MKILLLTYFFLHTFFATGQQLNGNYSTREAIGGVSISFNNKQKTFKYSADNCAGGIFGKGTFIVKENRLYLQFEKKTQLPEIPIKPPKIFLDSIKKEHTSIIIKVMSNRDTNKHIPNVSVHLKGTRIGAVTNNNGIAILKFTPAINDELTISSMDCEQETVYIKDTSTYSITVFIKCGVGIINIDNGQVQTYDIESDKENNIKLRFVSANGIKEDDIKIFYKKK